MCLLSGSFSFSHGPGIMGSGGRTGQGWISLLLASHSCSPTSLQECQTLSALRLMLLEYLAALWLCCCLRFGVFSARLLMRPWAGDLSLLHSTSCHHAGQFHYPYGWFTLHDSLSATWFPLSQLSSLYSTSGVYFHCQLRG